MIAVDQRDRLRWARYIGASMAALALWFAGIKWPLAPAPGLTPSWQTSLVDAHLRGRQFGTEVQFTYGPWGFLNQNFFLPEALGSKIAWEVFGRLALSLTLVLLGAGMPGFRRWAFLAGSVCVACFFETSALVLITLLAVVWLFPEESRAWQRGLAVAWLSFLAHQKFTFFMLAVLAVALSSACTGRSWRTGLAQLGGFILAYVALWLAAGQRVAGLPPYWRRSWEISSGYSWAMFLDPDPAHLACGLSVMLVVATVLWREFRGDAGAPRKIGVVIMLAGSWALAWKEGFTRADTLHLFGFFVYSFLMALALVCIPLPRRALFGMLLVMAISVLALDLVGPGFLAYGPRTAWQRIRSRPAELLDLAHLRSKFVDDMRIAQATAADPDLKSAVGRGTVDALTDDEGPIFLNGLDYDPRPVIQSYSAYTPSLLESNARFFRSTRAPEFVIVRLDAIDGRVPGGDDAPVLAELARSYQVVRVTPSYALLRRRDPPGGEGRPRGEPIAEYAPRFGDEIGVPDGRGHPVWITVEFSPTLLGRIRTLIYHASELQMVVTDEGGQSSSYRIVPGIGRAGFFIRPWLRDHGDFAALVNGRTNAAARTVRFEVIGAGGSWFWGEPRVRFLELADIPLERDGISGTR
jgi:hypothetical protein